MDSQRNLLIFALLFVSFLLWIAWEKDQVSQDSSVVIKAPTSTLGFAKQSTSKTNLNELIVVKTDVLELLVDKQGGDIVEANLLNYPVDLKSNLPFKLLEDANDFIYQAQSGLTGKDGPDNPANGSRPIFQADTLLYQLEKGNNTLKVILTYALNSMVYKKIFTLTRGSYAVNIDHVVENFGKNSLELKLFGQLKQSVKLPDYRDTGSSNFALHTYRGAAYSSSEDKYQKYSFSDIQEKSLNISTKNGWVAMLQQYFATAWIPRGKGINTFYSTDQGNNVIAIGFKSPAKIVSPNGKQDFQATLWVGPAIQSDMRAVSPNLDLTVDYGWLWFISQPLFKLLKFIYGFIHNWGFAIIIITFIVRGIMYPLTKAQYTSMAKMRMLQPKIQVIRETWGDNKQKISQEMMALYKTEKVNPLGGCFPLFVQMPIFLALYYMLMGSVELRQAPFILWIHDLSVQDPYYILPVFMGITMFVIQKMSPTTVTDPMQQKVITYMPVIFTIFFLWFPSGLVLYYIVSNLVTILQQQIIYRSLEKRGLHKS